MKIFKNANLKMEIWKNENLKKNENLEDLKFGKKALENGNLEKLKLQ